MRKKLKIYVIRTMPQMSMVGIVTNADDIESASREFIKAWNGSLVEHEIIGDIGDSSIKLKFAGNKFCVTEVENFEGVIL